MAELAEAGHETLIYEIPLLLESSQQHSFDAVIVAHAPAELREKRLVELRGFTPEDAAARVAAQVSDKSRLEIADWIIDTACDAAKTRQQVAAVWQQISAS